MRDNNYLNYSIWWDPDKVSLETLSKYAKNNEFIVAELDGVPVATAIIQQEQILEKDWQEVEQTVGKKAATYLFYVAVDRDFKGRHLAATLIGKAVEIARANGSEVLRLDANAEVAEVCSIYEGLGFKRVALLQQGPRKAAFYEKPV